MARLGITKDQVEQAIRTIQARGGSPSIDAIRIELGNTGSKSTIHRYLKELDIEQAAVTPKANRNLSDELGELVQAISERLQQEAWQIIAGERQGLEQEKQGYLAQIRSLEEQTRSLLDDQATQTRQLDSLQKSLGQLEQSWKESELERTRLAQQNLEQQKLLDERQHQINSLEEKHTHARNALEHYRQASKEQRDQDIRRHEQQTQLLQVEIRTLQQSLMMHQEENTKNLQELERLQQSNRHYLEQVSSQKEAFESEQAKCLSLLERLHQEKGYTEGLKAEQERALRKIEQQEQQYFAYQERFVGLLTQEQNQRAEAQQALSHAQLREKELNEKVLKLEQALLNATNSTN